MDYKKILEENSLTNFPVALGGCKNSERTLPCCEHNITIFDNKSENDSIINHDGEFIKFHHGSLQEKNSNVLAQFESMKILSDEQWDLRMLLSKVKEKYDKIFKDYAKNCLIDSLFCVTKTKEAIKRNDPFASSWQKCSAYFIADALSAINLTRPSPSHMLEYVREFEKNIINENFSVVNNCIGIERATPSLLSRMCKSTMGFSDMIEDNGHSKIIEAKHDYLVKNSLISDCYFYLGYVNRNNIIKIKNSIQKRPELIHVLKVAFDLENDSTKLEQQADLLQKTTNHLLSSVD